MPTMTDTSHLPTVSPLDVIERYGLATNYHVARAFELVLMAGQSATPVQDLQQAVTLLERFKQWSDDVGPASTERARSVTPEVVALGYGLVLTHGDAVRTFLSWADGTLPAQPHSADGIIPEPVDVVIGAVQQAANASASAGIQAHIEAAAETRTGVAA